jgi:formamidopyrimidine-DNA glycosylase
MPELPEVEASRALIARVAAGKTVAAVRAVESGGGPRSGLFDEIVVCEASERALAAALVGRRVAAVRRLGKQLWLEFSGAPALSLALHFGMTGAVSFRGAAGAAGETAARYRSHTVSLAAWPPRFCKLELELSDGSALAFTDPRRLGRVRLLRGSALAAPCLASLAPDALLALPPAAAFAAALAARGATPVKAVLLDQCGVLSGIGNYLADEVLFQARIHPETAAFALGARAAAALREKIADIVGVAVAAEADYERFPKDWLFHVRWGKGKGVIARTTAGHAISFATVGGRTSAVVAAVQGSRGVKTKAEHADAGIAAAAAAAAAASASSAAAGSGVSAAGAAAAIAAGTKKAKKTSAPAASAVVAAPPPPAAAAAGAAVKCPDVQLAPAGR